MIGKRLGLFHSALLVVFASIVYQLIVIVLLTGALTSLHLKLKNAYQSKEVINATFDLVRSVFSDYYSINNEPSSGNGFDKQAVQKACADAERHFSFVRSVKSADVTDENVLKELNHCLETYVALLNRALLEQRQGPKWANDHDFYPTLYGVLEKFLGLTSKLITNEEQSASYFVEVKNARGEILFLLGSAIVGSLFVSLLLGLLYAKSIKTPIDQMCQNSNLLAEQKPLLPELRERNELGKLDHSIHKAAEALYETLDKEKQLIESASEAIYSIDWLGTVKRTNLSGEQLLGASTDSIVGTSMLNWVAESDLVMADEMLYGTYGRRETRRFELQLKSANGGIINTRWSIQWSELDQLFFCIVHNITAEKKVERLKEQFRNVIRNDLRSPLKNIDASLEILAAGRDGQLSETLSRNLTSFQGNVRTLTKLVDTLLNFETMGDGLLQLAIVNVDLRKLLIEARELLHDASSQRNITVEVEGQIEPVKGDRDRLLQVITNLIGNAIKFSPEGSHIIVRLESDSDSAKLSVFDRAPLVPVEMRQAIFRPFKQTEFGRQNGGTGLGLSISKMIIDAHQGLIGVAQSDSHDGNVFFFSLPR